MKWAVLLLVTAWSAASQTNSASLAPDHAGSDSLPGRVESQPLTESAVYQHIERVRQACIHERRSLCGRILKILPAGLVIDSGYTNLLRAPLNRSWLVPGTVTASRAVDLIEGREPDAVCVGRVFLTDYPKSRQAKPKVYDYVIIEGYPAGEETYVSVGTVKRTVRKFSAVLEKAVDWHLAAEEAGSAAPRSGK